MIMMMMRRTLYDVMEIRILTVTIIYTLIVASPLIM